MNTQAAEAKLPNGACSAGTSFLEGGGEMGALIRDFDWSQTPLGDLARWPQSLKTSVSLMLNSRHPMWIGWKPQNTFLYNDAYLSVLGQAKHPWALGRPASVVWAEIWDICGPLADKVFERGEATFVDDVRLFMRRGADFLEETFYSFSYSPIRDESGGVGGLFCPSSEVTAKNIGTRRLATLSQLTAKALIEKTQERACAAATQILGSNLDDVPFALLYLIDAKKESAVLLGNSRFEANSPLAPGRIALTGTAGTHWPVQEVLRTGEMLEVATTGLGLPFTGAADQPITSAVVVPVKTGNEEHPSGVLVAGVNPTRRLDADYRAFYALVASQIATAVTNARISEEQRERAEALAALDRAKTTFFSNISHELRTPLTLMLAPLEDLLGAADSGNRRLLEVAHRNALRLLKLVNTLLEFSRIEAGRVQATFQPTDLAALTADLASVFRAAVEKAGINLVVDCPPLPDPVYVDREMWEKIVLNLLSNALKFTFEGEIRVSLRAAPGHVELEVKDTGVGIPATELPRLFERFHRVRGTRSRSHEGTGIGLALVQELARLHGGEVKAESLEGNGTKFIVSIQAGTAHLPREKVVHRELTQPAGAGARAFLEEAGRWLQDESPAAMQPGPGSGALPQKGHILLADDNADMRSYVSRLLAAEGFQVITAPDGIAALEHIAAGAPDLVLTDVMMPRMNGFELLAKLRSHPETRAIPVVMLSARAGEESRVEGLQAGADDYLTKPFSARELLARVSSQLAMSKLRKEGEKRVTRIVESITDGFQVLDRDWRFTYMNAAARRLVAANGLNADELIGKHYWNEAFPEAKGTQLEVLRKAMDDKEPVSFENFYEPWQRWFSVRAYPVEEGGITILFQDTTFARTAEEALREAHAELLLKQQQLNAALAASSTGTFQWNPFTDEFLDADHNFKRLWGFAPDEPVRHTSDVYARIHPDDLETVADEVERCRRGGTLELEFRVVHPDGSVHWVMDRAKAERDAAGNFTTVVGACTDITARKRAEEEVRAAGERFRFLAEAMPQKIFTARPDGFVDYVNQQWLAFIGAGADQLTGWNWLDWIHPENRKQNEARWRHALSTGEPLEIEHRIRAQDGAWRWHLTRARPMRGADGQITLWIGSNTDINDQKLQEERLESVVSERTAKLQEIISDLEAFSYTVSHDLRSPLRAMHGYAEELLASAADNLSETHKGYLDRIQRAAARLDRLTQEVLSYSRLARSEVSVGPIDIGKLVRDVVEQYPNLRGSGASIQIARNMPPVLGNEAYLTQAVSNLLSNAVKFVEQNRQIEIQIGAEQRDGKVRLYVQDNGIGIDPNHQGRIFQMFGRVHPEKKYPGTGVGLAIVKKSLEKMNGRVGFQSAPGQGSRFWIELPAA